MAWLGLAPFMSARRYLDVIFKTQKPLELLVQKIEKAISEDADFKQIFLEYRENDDWKTVYAET